MVSMQAQDTAQKKSPQEMAEALAESKNWSSMNLLSVDLNAILNSIGQSELGAATKIEDQTYIDNALRQMQLAKAFDLLDHTEQAFHAASRSLRTMDKLLALRKEQQLSEKIGNVNYESVLAPFYFRAGEHLATYIMLNTDEFGNVKTFSEEPDSEGEEGAADEAAEAVAETGAAQEEAKQEEAPAAPQTMMINTSAATPAPEAPKEDDKNGEANGDENYEQEALNYLSLALQIIGDFSAEGTCLEAQREDRKRLMTFLEIDSLLSRVQLFNHASDYKSALEDLLAVEALCTKYPEKNEQSLNSAIFQKGRCQMELKDYDEATASFVRVLDMFKKQLQTLSLAASKGQAGAAEEEKPISELVKPSIFDTEEMKRVKGLMIEVQEYINEIDYVKKNSVEIEKQRAEAQEQAKKASGDNVPEGFGKPQPDAEKFQTATFTLKPKKRTFTEMKAAYPADETAKADDEGAKRPKLEQPIENGEKGAAVAQPENKENLAENKA